MNYVSTRGEAPILPFDDVLLAGLARDGGLYVPEVWPVFSATEIATWKDLSYEEIAGRVIGPFVGNTVTQQTLKKIISSAYSHFNSADIAPLKELPNGEWILELFHGPTLAFKDFAMQFLGPLFDHVLREKNKRICIVGATSGDTGSAAIDACKGRDNIDIFILYPHGRISDVQRRQMTTVAATNVHTIALLGTFDDCQDMVKALFNDLAFRDRMNLSAVNSINWARIMAQIVYYFWAALKVGGPKTPVSFAVPTGNFGNVFAGYAAHRMGLPVKEFFVGSNSNDILTCFFESGEMKIGNVVQTLSPSMDIQISSNFERLLFELYNRDSSRISTLMSNFRQDGSFTVDKKILTKARKIFRGERYTDDEILKLISTHYEKTETFIDPHTAVGLAAGRACRADNSSPLVTLATAHPAKFPGAVKTATSFQPNLPYHMINLFELEERINVRENNVGKIKEFIEEHAKPGSSFQQSDKI